MASKLLSRTKISLGRDGVMQLQQFLTSCPKHDDEYPDSLSATPCKLSGILTKGAFVCRKATHWFWLEK